MTSHPKSPRTTGNEAGFAFFHGFLIDALDAGDLGSRRVTLASHILGNFS